MYPAGRCEFEALTETTEELFNMHESINGRRTTYTTYVSISLISQPHSMNLVFENASPL